MRWTTVPSAWSGQRLFDWGRRGLRSEYNRWVRAPGRRPRKTFDFAHTGELAMLLVGSDRRLLLRVRRLAPDEIWPVYERRGRWWRRAYYLVPRAALAAARKELTNGKA